MWTVNFLMFKLVLEKAEEAEIKLPTSTGSSKKQESTRKNIYFCFIAYAKAFDRVDHNKLWKILLQHHSLKASILPRSAFFTVQLSHPYMTTGKTISHASKVMLKILQARL